MFRTSKTLLIIIIIILKSITMSKAQKNNQYYQSMLNNIKSIERYLDQNNIAQTEKYVKYAEKNLNKALEQDPGVDVSEARNTIQKAKNWVEVQKQAAANLDAEIKAVMDWKHPLDQVKRVSIYQPEEFWNKFQNFDKTELLTKIKKLKGQPTFDKKGYEKHQILEIENLLQNYPKIATENQVLSKLADLVEQAKSGNTEQDIQIRLNIAEIACRANLKLLGTSNEIQSYLQEIEKVGADIKGFQDSKIVKPKKNYIDKLPAPVQKNTQWEQEMLEAIRFQNFPGVTVLKAIITDANWVVQKGINFQDTYRSMESAILMKNAEGECYIQYFNFKQPATGTNTWGKTLRKSTGSRYYIDCTKID